MYKFLIVDDHSIFRQGVKKIIIDNYEQAEFGEANNSAEAISQLNCKKWDMAIIDINMPGRSGLDLIHEIYAIKPSLPILALSMYEENQMSLRTLKAGAKGYLTKSRAINDLITAITRILEGKQYISETVAELLVNELKLENTKDFTKNLSDREYFVLLRLSSGESVTEISRTLSLSVKTISTYRTRIMKKLNLKNNVQLFNFMNGNKLD